MNPIARMMKRYIKTPLKYALPLLFIGSLVLVSISGCLFSTPSDLQYHQTSSTTATTNNTTTAKTTTKSTATKSPVNTPTTPPNPTATLQPTATPTLTVSSTPTPIPPTPTPTPTPVPKPQCNHVDIVVYHPANTPCSMCIERRVALDDFANQHKPYVATTWQEVPTSSWGVNTPRVSATVRETGISQNFDATWSESQIMVWASGALGC